MENHLYSFNGNLRRQSWGGAIGNILTGSLGVLYTVFWCKAFLDNVKDATSEIKDFISEQRNSLQNIANRNLSQCMCECVCSIFEFFSLSSLNLYAVS